MLTNIFYLYCNYTKDCFEIAQSRNYFLDFMHIYAFIMKEISQNCEKSS